MEALPFNFYITADKPISRAFRALALGSFAQAARWVQDLPYARNRNKQDPMAVLTDGHGTCSTKHALLKRLADENGEHDLLLVIGLFRMNARNTPAVKATLEHHRLEHIPEAHCYLKYHGVILDHTKPGSTAADFADDLIEEQVISPDQITTFKVEYQRSSIANWLASSAHNRLSLEEIWSIREQCIQDLADAHQRKTKH